MSTLIDPSLTTDDHEPSRDELCEALAHMNHRAKREMSVVGSEKLKTPWDRRHEEIDQMLDDLEAMDASA